MQDLHSHPYPAPPDFSTGKGSRNFQSPNGSLQISFACHPYSGGRIKPHSSDFPISTTMHSAAKISPSVERRRQRHQKGCISVVETLQRVSKSGEVCP